jgi:hypothetical protein
MDGKGKVWKRALLGNSRSQVYFPLAEKPRERRDKGLTPTLQSHVIHFSGCMAKSGYPTNHKV